MVKTEKLEIDQKNVESLRKAQPPTSETQLRSFLRFCNACRRFICSFAKIGHPLNRLLKKRILDWFRLDDERREAFDILIHIICSPPFLTLPGAGLSSSIYYNASNYGVGCALFQTRPNGEWMPIDFWSRSLLQAEEKLLFVKKGMPRCSVGVEDIAPVLDVGTLRRVYKPHSASLVVDDRRSE